jgi:hypothetical protein
MYKNDQLVGWHIILLGNNCEKAAFDALHESKIKKFSKSFT